MINRAKRIVLFIVGIVALGLGALGVILPLLPTTPFILVAAFAFANSSQRLHQWLLDHRLFGPLIANWRRYRAISRKAKITSIVSMFAIVAISILLRAPIHAIVIQIIILSMTATFILTRPEPPQK